MDQVAAYLTAHNRPTQMEDAPNGVDEINVYPEMYMRVVFACFHSKLTRFADGHVFMDKLMTFLDHFRLLPRKFTQPSLDMDKLQELLRQYASNDCYHGVDRLALHTSGVVPDDVLAHIRSLNKRLEQLVDEMFERGEAVQDYFNRHAELAQRLYALSIYVYYDAQMDYLERVLKPQVQELFYEQIRQSFAEMVFHDYKNYFREMLRFCIHSEYFRQATGYPNVNNSIDTRYMEYLVGLGLWDNQYRWQPRILQGVAQEGGPILPMPVQVNLPVILAQVAEQYLYSCGILPPLSQITEEYLFELLVEQMVERANESPDNLRYREQETPDPLELRSMIIWLVVVAPKVIKAQLERAIAEAELYPGPPDARPYDDGVPTSYEEFVRAVTHYSPRSSNRSRGSIRSRGSNRGSQPPRPPGPPGPPGSPGPPRPPGPPGARGYQEFGNMTPPFPRGAGGNSSRGSNRSRGSNHGSQTSSPNGQTAADGGRAQYFEFDRAAMQRESGPDTGTSFLQTFNRDDDGASNATTFRFGKVIGQGFVTPEGVFEYNLTDGGQPSQGSGYSNRSRGLNHSRGSNRSRVSNREQSPGTPPPPAAPGYQEFDRDALYSRGGGGRPSQGSGSSNRSRGSRGSNHSPWPNRFQPPETPPPAAASGYQEFDRDALYSRGGGSGKGSGHGSHFQDTNFPPLPSYQTPTYGTGFSSARSGGGGSHGSRTSRGSYRSNYTSSGGASPYSPGSNLQPPYYETPPSYFQNNRGPIDPYDQTLENAQDFMYRTAERPQWLTEMMNNLNSAKSAQFANSGQSPAVSSTPSPGSSHSAGPGHSQSASSSQTAEQPPQWLTDIMNTLQAAKSAQSAAANSNATPGPSQAAASSNQSQDPNSDHSLGCHSISNQGSSPSAPSPGSPSNGPPPPPANDDQPATGYTEFNRDELHRIGCERERRGR